MILHKLSKQSPRKPTSQPGHRAVQSQNCRWRRQGLRGCDAGIHRDHTRTQAIEIAGHFLSTRRRRPLNPSVFWRQAQTQRHKRYLGHRRAFYPGSLVSRREMTIVEVCTGLSYRHNSVHPEQRAKLSTSILAHRPSKPVVAVIYSHSHPTTMAA